METRNHTSSGRPRADRKWAGPSPQKTFVIGWRHLSSPLFCGDNALRLGMKAAASVVTAAAPAMEPGPSVSPGPSRSFKEELLCAVCYDPFRDAVTLRCGHNFCRRCVSGCWEVQTTPSCPVCKERAVPGELRTNHTLNNLVETLLREEAEGARWTGRRSPRPCRAHRAPLTLFCVEDKELLCCACQADARHQEHRVQPIKDTAQDFRVSTAPARPRDPPPRYPSLHPGLATILPPIQARLNNAGVVRFSDIRAWRGQFRNGKGQNLKP